MRAILAQGNPGSNYQKTRHNVGWRFLDAYAKSHSAPFTTRQKFRADIAEITQAGEKILLIKPTTFYNDTGFSARAIADFYHIAPENFLIVHDELALPLGTLRTRLGGSSAGNNGIKSLTSHLGEGTARLRIGIFDAAIPRDALASVLGKFTADEEKVLTALEPEIFDLLDNFCSGDFPTTTKVVSTT